MITTKSQFLLNFNCGVMNYQGQIIGMTVMVTKSITK